LSAIGHAGKFGDFHGPDFGNLSPKEMEELTGYWSFLLQFLHEFNERISTVNRER